MALITTPRITHTNQAFESQIAQPTSLPEGPIRIIPAEIVKFILFFTNQRYPSWNLEVEDLVLFVLDPSLL